MTVVRNSGTHQRESDPFIVWLIAMVGAVHTAMTMLVPDLVTKFQLGDRAWDRTAKISDILAAQDLNSVLAAVYYHGAPGDYLFFLPAYAAFGPVGVIAQNVVLLLIGVWFLYRIGVTWFSPAVAKIAAVIYVLLPATIFHPQVFVTEAICNPLLIVVLWYAGRILDPEEPARRDVVLFGLVSAVLVFTRYLYLLLPLVVAGLLMLRATRWRDAVGPALLALALSYSLVLAWSGMAALNNGRYETGFNFQGLGSNLFLRAERMERMGGPDLVPAVKEKRTLTVGEFASNAWDNPAALVRSIVSDAVNLAANPGAAMVYGRYFGMFGLNEADDKDTFKWRDIRDRSGTLAMIKHLWKVSPVGLVMNMMMAGVLMTLYLGSIVGGWQVLRDRARPLAFRLLVFAIPVYVAGFTFASGSVRWDHRSPLEFVLCILFAFGVATAVERLRQGALRLPQARSREGHRITS